MPFGRQAQFGEESKGKEEKIEKMGDRQEKEEGLGSRGNGAGGSGGNFKMA